MRFAHANLPKYEPGGALQVAGVNRNKKNKFNGAKKQSEGQSGENLERGGVVLMGTEIGIEGAGHGRKMCGCGGV